MRFLQLIGIVTRSTAKNHKKRYYLNHAVEDLQTTQYLYSSDYLNELYDKAENVEMKSEIYAYLEKYTATEIKSYKKLSDKIWRDMYES